MVGAIVLAAGASSRMGRAKALLPSGDGRSFLARLVATLREGGAAEVVAVLGQDAERVSARALADGVAARLVRNPDPDRGQLSSLLVGLDALGGLSPDAVLVIPVDLPLVVPDTVRRVVEAWRASGAPLARPFRPRDGRHGHPVLFAARLFAELRSADASQGARQVVRAHAAEALDVAVEDDGAFDDIDTPADYDRLIGGGVTS